jgi:hypothetical protein
MGLFSAQRCVWDFWFAQNAHRTHLLFLYAPLSLNNPNLRH